MPVPICRLITPRRASLVRLLAAVWLACAWGPAAHAATPSTQAGLATQAGTADADPITACIAQNADDGKRHDCMSGVVAAAEQDVERAYQDALRIRRGRAEETRANASDIEITDGDWNVIIESQTAWRAQYDEQCADPSGTDTARLSCQYDLLRARLHDLQQMN